MKTTINQRIKTLINSNNHSQIYVAKKIGITKQAVHDLCTAGSVGIKPIIKLLDLYKDVNARWLILGDGEMKKDEAMICAEPKENYSTNKLEKEIALLRKDFNSLKNTIDKLIEKIAK